MTITSKHFHALLVGINQYASSDVRPLSGCVNDVGAMAQLLQDRYGVPKENIHRLVNAEATHAAIKAAFEEHLIGAAEAWVAAGSREPKPAFLFHFSGHGSQAVDETGTEPDGLDETIVPHDGRTEKLVDGRREMVFDIKDWELAERIARLSAVSPNVTIILDSCHSGSGTRALDDGMTGLDAVRQCEPDLRPGQSARPVGEEAGTRGTPGPSDWIGRGQHVLLAGCRDGELSHEMWVEEDEQGGRRRHGALTYHLVRALAQMPPDRKLTYAELHTIVKAQVMLRYASQTPQCEGDREREVFGGLRPARDALLAVRVQGEEAIVEGGLPHGLSVGAELAVYPPETRRVADAGPPLAALIVVHAGSIESRCRIEPAGTALPAGARAAITQYSYGAQRSRVALAVEDAALARSIAERIADANKGPDLSRIVEVVAIDASPDLHVVQKAGKLVLQDPSGSPLVAPFAESKVEDLVQDLAHIARYRNGVRLRNLDPASAMGGKVTLEVLRLKRDAGGNFVAGANGLWETEPLPLGDDGAPVLTAVPEPEDVNAPLDARADCVAFKISNEHSQPLHAAILNYAPDWSVNLVYPFTTGAQEAIPPQGRHIEGIKPGEEIPVVLTKGMPEGREIWKLIATLQATDFAVLEQKALKSPHESRAADTKGGESSPLQDLLDQAANGSTRATPRRRVQPTDDWTTVEVEGSSVLHEDFQGKTLAPGGDTDLAYGLKITAPAGFTAKARILTADAATRALDGDPAALQPPPALAAFGQWFQPIGLGSTASRGDPNTGALGADAAAIELTSDQPVWNAVSADDPLRIGLPDGFEAADGVFAVAHDGERYFPVGRIGNNQQAVDVAWLPPPVARDEGGEDATATKSLKGAIRLYLFKAADMPMPELGLFRSRFLSSAELAASSAEQGEREQDERKVPVVGGEFRYAVPRPGMLKAGQRAALFVHGFTSDSRWMARGVVDWLARNEHTYNLVLTFDYETMGTPIAANGKTLAEQLELAGFGPDDGVTLDVFAHSMGTQVVRSMVELHGGHAYVDRIFLAGPPNDGTVLANLKRPAIWLLTLLLNHAGPTPPVAVASWALKKIGDNLPGIDDLRPGSELYAKLNAPGAQRAGLYHVLIGDNSVRPEEKSAWKRAAQRLAGPADQVLDTFFQSDNDLVIGVASAQSLARLVPDAQLKNSVVPCNHFRYFEDEASRSKLLAWLKA